MIARILRMLGLKRRRALTIDERIQASCAANLAKWSTPQHRAADTRHRNRRERAGA